LYKLSASESACACGENQRVNHNLSSLNSNLNLDLDSDFPHSCREKIYESIKTKKDAGETPRPFLGSFVIHQ